MKTPLKMFEIRVSVRNIELVPWTSSYPFSGKLCFIGMELVLDKFFFFGIFEFIIGMDLALFIFVFFGLSEFIIGIDLAFFIFFFFGLSEFIIGMDLALFIFFLFGLSSGVFSTILLKEKLVKSGNMNNNGFSKNFSRNFLKPKMLVLIIRI